MLTVNLEGELALITGGGTGIGYAIASAFVDAGASVVMRQNNSGQKYFPLPTT